METLEILKLTISASVPILIAIFGFIFSRHLKTIEHSQWQNRKIIEIRLDLYKDLAPKFNSMFCFCSWVGDWKEISPADMIRYKRETDKTVNVYRHLFGKKFYESYNRFIHTVFQPFNGPGQDAKIRSAIYGRDGDRRSAYKPGWDQKWDSLFAPDSIPPGKELFQNYNALMNEFRICIGLSES